MQFEGAVGLDADGAGVASPLGGKFVEGGDHLSGLDGRYVWIGAGLNGSDDDLGLTGRFGPEAQDVAIGGLDGDAAHECEVLAIAGDFTCQAGLAGLCHVGFFDQLVLGVGIPPGEAVLEAAVGDQFDGFSGRYDVACQEGEGERKGYVELGHGREPPWEWETVAHSLGSAFGRQETAGSPVKSPKAHAGGSRVWTTTGVTALVGCGEVAYSQSPS